jgi:hypothetical protein
MVIPAKCPVRSTPVRRIRPQVSEDLRVIRGKLQERLVAMTKAVGVLDRWGRRLDDKNPKLGLVHL